MLTIPWHLYSFCIGVGNKRRLNTITILTSNNDEDPALPDGKNNWRREFHEEKLLGDRREIYIDSTARYLAVYSQATKETNNAQGGNDESGLLVMAEVEVYGTQGELWSGVTVIQS